MKTKVLVLLSMMTIFFSCSDYKSQPVVLDAQQTYIVVETSGTVTFNGKSSVGYLYLKDNPVLQQIDEMTYQAGIIFSTSFSKDYWDERGKIFNFTEKDITVNCQFYSGSTLLGSNVIFVKSKTFSRLVPGDVPRDNKEITKIVCEY